MADDTNPTTTIIREKSGGGMTAIIILLLVIALAVGGYFAFIATDSTVKKNDAVAGAAKSVGDTADKFGDAVQPSK